jgi:hypothetical protein
MVNAVATFLQSYCLVGFATMFLYSPSSVRGQSPALAPITMMMEQLDNKAMPNQSPTIPRITGPFYVEIQVQFYDLASSSRTESYQRMFAFSSASFSHTISLSKQGVASVAFQYSDDQGNNYLISVDDDDTAVAAAVTVGTTDLWRVGVDGAGEMTLYKNGVLLGSRNGVPPPAGAVIRNQRLLGMSNADGSDGLKGLISSLKVQNLDGPKLPAFRSLANLPAQIFSQQFKASVYARVDDTSSARLGQPIFELSDTWGDNRISFSQNPAISTGMILSIHQNNGTITSSCETTAGAINKEVMTLWKVEMNGSTWKIQRNSKILNICPDMVAPAAVFRRQMLFGQSVLPAVPILDGVVLGFRLDP